MMRSLYECVMRIRLVAYTLTKMLTCVCLCVYVCGLSMHLCSGSSKCRTRVQGEWSRNDDRSDHFGSSARDGRERRDDADV